jgi:hypothetical protein
MSIPNAEHVSAEQLTEIEQLSKKSPSDEELFREVGRSLGPGATGESPEERGRAAVKRLLRDIRAATCANHALRVFCEDPNTIDATQIVVAISGALIAAGFAGINPVLIAYLVARIGLRKVCENEWKP